MGVTATVPIYLELRLAGIHAPPGRAATGGRRHGKGIKEPTGARIRSPRAPRRERAAQVAPDRRLAEDRGGAWSAHPRGLGSASLHRSDGGSRAVLGRRLSQDRCARPTDWRVIPCRSVVSHGRGARSSLRDRITITLALLFACGTC